MIPPALVRVAAWAPAGPSRDMANATSAIAVRRIPVVAIRFIKPGEDFPRTAEDWAGNRAMHDFDQGGEWLAPRSLISPEAAPSAPVARASERRLPMMSACC